MRQYVGLDLKEALMEIENYREQPNTGPVEAIFDIYLPKMQCRFRNYRLVRSKNGNRFVSPPSFPIDGSDGKKKYIPVIEFSRERQEEFNHKVLQALKSFHKP